MSVFLTGILATLGVAAGILIMWATGCVVLIIIGLIVTWQPPRDEALDNFDFQIRGFEFGRDLRGPYILAATRLGVMEKFRMGQRVERIEYRDIDKMRTIVFFRKVTK